MVAKCQIKKEARHDHHLEVTVWPQTPPFPKQTAALVATEARGTNDVSMQQGESVLGSKFT